VLLTPFLVREAFASLEDAGPTHLRVSKYDGISLLLPELGQFLLFYHNFFGNILV
jgi:hypothetical protein